MYQQPQQSGGVWPQVHHSGSVYPSPAKGRNPRCLHQPPLTAEGGEGSLTSSYSLPNRWGGGPVLRLLVKGPPNPPSSDAGGNLRRIPQAFPTAGEVSTFSKNLLTCSSSRFFLRLSRSVANKHCKCSVCPHILECVTSVFN